ncbi:GAF domain-containing sensor histidine kinase [Microbispora sp. NPDC046933]|uniref:sensor histidine kinase n=1 Tax=Microbispora sp. NPDC046933 TaxID=3155618 RepID=UPI0033C7C5E2
MSDRSRFSPAAAGPTRRTRLKVVIAVASGIALVFTAAGFGLAAGVGWRTFVDSYTLTNLVIGTGFLASGATIAWFHGGRNIIGVLFVVCGLGHLTTAAAGMACWYAVGVPWPDPVLRTLVTVFTGAWQLGIVGLFPLALLVFPDGRLPARRWRPLGWLIVVSGTYQMVTGLLSGAPLAASPRATSILSVDLVVPGPIDAAASLANAALWVLVVSSLVVRYRRGDERTRRQLLWLILALMAMLVLNAQRWITGDGPILFLLSFVLVPVAIGIAIVRYELFDIRLVLSRALLYGLVLSVIIAVYAGLVAGFSLLVPDDARRGVSIMAAIVVAIGFTPLRLLLQGVIERAFYGTRSDPAGTARRAGERLRHDDLTGVLERTRAALRLPWLALREPDGTGLAAAGEPTDSPAVEIPLSYRGDLAGTLVVGLRRGESHLHDDDRHTLDLIGTPLAVALHAIALREQVQRARTATVEAGAVERVRLQRELHDGLGPTLTSIAFRADAAFNVLRSDAAEAERLLGEVRGDLRDAIDSVRRVVYGLRPIELDDLGLVGALARKAATLSGGAGHGVAVKVEAHERLPELSPAVELAAYRIANEALANVVRHSGARRCLVTVSAGGDLVLTVRDDGDPPPSWRPGVGLRSMADRAEEVGGTATAGPAGDGWEVVARLPLHPVGLPRPPGRPGSR